MATVTFGDPAKVAPTAKRISGSTAPKSRPSLFPPDLPAETSVLNMWSTVGAMISARHALYAAIMRVWEIDVDAIGDPRNADHPLLPQMVDAYNKRLDEEIRAWQVVVEYANGVEWLWRSLSTAQRHASGAVAVLGLDPSTDAIANDLLASSGAMASIAPLPETVEVSEDVVYMVGRMPGVTVSWESACENAAPF